MLDCQNGLLDEFRSALTTYHQSNHNCK